MDAYFNNLGDDKVKFSLVSQKAKAVLSTQSESVRKNFKGEKEKSIIVNTDMKNRLLAWCVSHDLQSQSI